VDRPTIEAPRLVLRPFAAADAVDVQRLAGDRAIADTTLNVPHPYRDGLAAEWIAAHQRQYDAGESMILAITLRATGELVGAIGLRIDRAFNRAELGYWVGTAFWSRGYCTEAARAVLDFAFTTLGLNRVHATHLARNPASGRVMQKIGMAREGVARQHVTKWGRYEDLVLYGLIREDWLGARRRALEETTTQR
jgi:ribosomal-protein-alanine N-acetyltransferase